MFPPTIKLPHTDMVSIASQLPHFQKMFHPLVLLKKSNTCKDFMKYLGLKHSIISFQTLNFKTFGWHVMLCYASYN